MNKHNVDNVVQGYLDEVYTGPRGGRIQAAGGNIYVDKSNRYRGTTSAIYSYGSHFIIVAKLNGIHLFNGDRYSPTTASHQRAIRNALEKHDGKRVTISFTMLNQILRAYESDDFQVIDSTPDLSLSKTVESEDTAKQQVKEWRRKYDIMPEVGQVSITECEYRENEYEVSFHSLGAVLLKIRDRYILCAMDEGSYFASELPKKARSVQEAFELLKPKSVLKAEKEGREVKRQGEWFFIKKEDLRTTAAKKFSEEFLNEFLLLKNESNRNVHCVQFKHPTINNFVSGKVKHLNRSTLKLSGEHKTIDLGLNYWEVVCNTSLTDFSSSGKDLD